LHHRLIKQAKNLRILEKYGIIKKSFWRYHMKYVAQNWDNSHDGILFFFQRIEEMLFHYSSDIVRMPVYNSKTLMLEYIVIENEVSEKKIKEYQLEQVAGELINSIENDKILKDYFGDSYIEQIIKSIKKDRSQTIHYLNNQITGRQYFDLASEYLKKHTPTHNHKNEIEYGIRAWITMLIYQGYSPEYVYNRIRQLFLSRVENPEKLLTDFIDSFVLKERNYRVYFSFSRYLTRYKELIGERLGMVFEEFEQVNSIKKKNDFVGYFNINSYDAYSAMKRAYQKINIFVKFFRVISNHKQQLIRNFGIVMDTGNENYIKIPIKPLGYKSIELEPNANLTQIIDNMVLNCQKKGKTIYLKLNRIIDLHNDAIQQTDLKDGFVNLWSILEMVGLDINSESKIESVINNLLPVLHKDYFSNVLSNIHEDLRDNLSHSDYSMLLTKLNYSDGEVEKYIAKFIFYPEFEGLRDEYFIKLKNFPIIRNKIYNLWLVRNSKKEIFKISQRYIKRVKWHIYRLYRTRNSIVHAGKVGYGLQMLGEHLHIYVDAVITDIVTKLALKNNLQTINDVLLDAKLILINIEKAFNNDNNITDEDVELLCRDIIYI